MVEGPKKLPSIYAPRNDGGAVVGVSKEIETGDWLDLLVFVLILFIVLFGTGGLLGGLLWWLTNGGFTFSPSLTNQTGVMR
jgi:hypothetical protein